MFQIKFSCYYLVQRLNFRTLAMYFQFLNYTCQDIYFTYSVIHASFINTSLSYEILHSKFACSVLSYSVFPNIHTESVNYINQWEQHITKFDQGSTYPNSPRTTRQVGCKSPLWAINLVITPSFLNTFGRVYWVLSMGHIPLEGYIGSSQWDIYIGLHIQLMQFYYRLLVAPRVLSDSFALPFINVFNIKFQHVLNWSLHSISSEILYIRF